MSAAVSLFIFLVILAASTPVATGMAPPAPPPPSSSCDNLFRVLLLRHGQTDANAGGVIQGSSDISRLTDLGRQQAARVVQALRHDDDRDGSPLLVSAVYLSPLTRVQETFQVIKEEMSSDRLPNAVTLENLREIDFYDWESRDKNDLQQMFPVSWRAWKEGNPDDLIVYEQGVMAHKPLLELWERADTVWDEIFALQNTVGKNPLPSKSILIVAHGSLGQALLGTAMGWDAAYFRQHEFPNCGMAELIWDNASVQANEDTRPLATKWRWKWPEISNEWCTREKAQEISQPR